MAKSKEKVVWTRDETWSLINCVEEREILWNSTLKEYKNKVKKEAAFAEVANLLKTKSVGDIKKKLQALRSQHCGERMKIRKNKSGSDANCNYMTKWEFFNALNFMFKDAGSAGSVVDSMPLTKMLEACRTCLRLINVDNWRFYEIEADDMQLSAESCRYKLLSIVPEMALNITPKSILCAECHGKLEELFNFKEKCLEIEKIIVKYFQTKPDLDMKNFDLKDVSAFNVADIKINEVEFVEGKENIIKEEVELSDTAIVKHEVDDFSLETFEIARSKDTVPGSSADIKISEDTVVEATFEDDAVKEEVKLFDTVVTNLKHELDNFSSESVEVARPNNAVLGSNLTCKYCEKLCENSTSLKIHLRTHTGEKSHRCEICNRRFLKKHNLTVHLRTHTGERPYVCNICGKRYFYNYNLLAHMRNHNGEKPFRCEICDRSFPIKFHLQTHLRTHTGERPYSCDVCKKSFSLKPTLTVHMRSHTGEKPYLCEVCARSFAAKVNLRKHLRIHTGERSYICTVCNKGFNANNELTLHQRTHTGEKPYLCNVCGKGYPRNFELKIHLRSHTGEKPHCCETCGRKFFSKAKLTTHLHVHTGRRPYVCAICEKGFTTNFLLTVHMRIHTGEKPYCCEICNRRFNKKQHLTVHLRTHTGERLYSCKTCGRSFANKMNLTKHFCVNEYSSSFKPKEHTRILDTEQPLECEEVREKLPSSST